MIANLDLFLVCYPTNYCFDTQGSESFESWQANLLFEPVQFEVIVTIAGKVLFSDVIPLVKGMNFVLFQIKNNFKFFSMCLHFAKLGQ